MSHSSENGTGFRPIRRGQVIDEIEEVESEQAESSSTAFTRRKTEQTQNPPSFRVGICFLRKRSFEERDNYESTANFLCRMGQIF